MGRNKSNRSLRWFPLVRNWLGLAVAVVLLNACASKGPAPVEDRRAGSAAVSSVKEKSRPGWYRVRKGDTLYSVAWKAGVDYKTLARWNNIDRSYTIYAGQLLRLTPPKRVSTPSRNKTKPETPKTAARTARKTEPKKKKKVAAVPSPAPAPAQPPSSPKTEAVAKPTQPAVSGKLRWQWPASGRVIARFSARDPDKDGIKIAGSRGQRVVAAEAGKVVYVGSGLIGYGQLIIVKHRNEFLSAYGHNSKLRVKEGDLVKRGQHISDMGSNSAGRPMLHFEIRRYGKPVDPLAYLPKR